MRRTLAVVLVAWLACLPLPGAAQAGVSETDRGAIEVVIRAQLAAFARDDADAAYGLASPTIRALFPTPGIFMEMVRRAYLPVYRASEARFRPPEPTAEGIRQPVVLRGPDQRLWLAFYSMQQQPDGGFLIDGCMLVALPDAGA